MKESLKKFTFLCWCYNILVDNIKLRSKIKIGNRETTNVVCQIVLTHLTVKFTDVSFFGYICI